MSSSPKLSEQNLRQEIILAAKRLHQRNMLAAADGNISYRISDDKILITPTGKSKILINPEDIAVITLQNEILMRAELLGSITNLPDEEVTVLKAMRKKLGNKIL